MRVIVPLCLCFIIFTSLGCAAEKNLPSGSSSNVSCVAGCGVTFAELVPNRAQYDSERIYISGFLALTHGLLSLQPSEQAYMSSIGDADSIIFRMSVSDQKKIIDSHLNKYVSVRGVFNVGSGDPLVGIGYFSGEVDVYNKITRDKYESIDDWRVRLEDFEK